MRNENEYYECAFAIAELKGNINLGSHKNGLRLASITVIAFTGLIGLLVNLGELPIEVLFLYIVASSLTFVVFSIDKMAAVNGRQRISESMLHMLSLIGGWPGGVLAQQKLRHKTLKQPFRTIMFAMILINLIFLAWLLTPTGTNIMSSVLEAAYLNWLF